MKVGKLSTKIDWESEEYDEFLEEQVIASHNIKLRKSFRRNLERYAEGIPDRIPEGIPEGNSEKGRNTGAFVR